MSCSRRPQVFAALTFVLLYATLDPAVAQVSAPTAPEPPGAPAERTAAPGTVGEVVIVEASQGEKKLELGEITTSRLSAPVTFEEQKGGAIAEAEVRLSHFRHENGTTHEAKFVLEQGETLATLGKSGSVRGSIQVDLPLSGAYKGQLRIVHDGTVRSRYTVTVTRKNVAAPITIGDLNAILVQRSCGPVILDINTTFRATGGAPLALPAPSVSIIRTLKDDQVIGVPEASAAVLDGEGKPIETTTVKTQFTPVRLRIAGIEEAGKHQVKIQFAPAGYEPIDRTFTVYVKDPWGLAAVFIFLGVAASFALRTYWTEKRPRLLVERRVASLMDRLARAERDAVGDATALEMIALVRGALGEAWRDVALSDKWSEATAFDLLEEKVRLLPSWISALQLVAEAEPASLKKALEEVLEPVEKALRRSAVEATELETHRKTLEDFPITYEDKVREAMEAAKEAAKAGDPMGPGTPQPAELIALGKAASWSRGGFVPPAAEDFTSIQWRLTTGDLLASLAILLIATILGVKVLWSGELVWGTWTDRIVALLWGLGLHQFTFDGIAGLTSKLRT